MSFQAGRSLMMGIYVHYITIETSQREQMIPVLFSSLNLAMISTEDHASLHFTNSYRNLLLFARYCTRLPVHGVNRV